MKRAKRAELIPPNGSPVRVVDSQGEHGLVVGSAIGQSQAIRVNYDDGGYGTHFPFFEREDIYDLSLENTEVAGCEPATPDQHNRANSHSAH